MLTPLADDLMTLEMRTVIHFLLFSLLFSPLPRLPAEDAGSLCVLEDEGGGASPLITSITPRSLLCFS